MSTTYFCFSDIKGKLESNEQNRADKIEAECNRSAALVNFVKRHVLRRRPARRQQKVEPPRYIFEIGNEERHLQNLPFCLGRALRLRRFRRLLVTSRLILLPPRLYPPSPFRYSSRALDFI